jgi:L,D-transpeptidase ErfK/SrfK
LAVKMKTSLFIIMALLTAPGVASAAEYELAPGSDVVGQIHTIVPDFNTNFVDIARKYNVAFTELQEANSNVDPWNPGGKRIIIPGRHVMPPGPRDGVVINLAELRLYYFKDGGRTVVTFPVGVGVTEWATPIISARISEKRVNPEWRIPESIRSSLKAKGYNVPAVVPAGPDNPLGDYAMRIGGSDYLVHGTDSPDGVGRRVSHGCVRLYPEDIQALFQQVPMGTPIRIVHEPYKFGWSNGKLFLEYHAALKEYREPPGQVAISMREALHEFIQGQAVEVLPGMLNELLHRADGMPGLIAQPVMYSSSDRMDQS